MGASSIENSLDWDLLGLDSEDEDDSDIDEEARMAKELAENRLIGENTIYLVHTNLILL